MYPAKRNRKTRAGLSLFEVILALAILGVSGSFLVRAMQLASQNARKAQNLAQAEIVAESVVNQIVAGVLPAQPVTWTPYGVSLSSTAWLYAITMVPAEVQGMLGVQVAVRDSSRVTSSEQPDLLVTRWIIDPSLALDVPPETEATDATGSTSSTGSGTATQSSNSGVGGIN